ncbi:hypothetical protein E1297_00805 [Roseibium sp. RKSG952]|nr:hypothetical protein [Roseibium sp. RKSG952]
MPNASIPETTGPSFVRKSVGNITSFPQIHRERIKDVIDEARSTMEEAGVSLKDARFPFILHHERMKSAFRTGGLRLTHSEIYALLSLWAAERGEPDDYAWQVVGGALDLLRVRGEVVPEDVRSHVDRVYGSGDFLEFCRSRLASASERKKS